jgi:hypothetical protein
MNATETHAMLASKCIQRMASDNGPRKDICNVREPEKSRDEIGKAIVANHIPPDLDYACHYWVFHLRLGRALIETDDIKGKKQNKATLKIFISTEHIRENG